MSAREIIELAVMGLTVIVTVIYIVVKGIKNKWLSKIVDTIKTSIAEAEKTFGRGEGDKKKKYVLEAVEAKCKELDIPYESLFTLINKLIDTIIDNYNVIAKK